MTQKPLGDLLNYLALRSSEVTRRITDLAGKENKDIEDAFELERLKSKSFEFDRIVRFRTDTDFMGESEYNENLKELFGI